MRSEPEAVPVAEVKAQLQRVLASRPFASARRQQAFLEFVVEAELSGRAIKESLIGVEVYRRDPLYDPKTDGIVRVEASRVRAKLLEHYEGEGREDPVRIELPKGTYRPVFRRQEQAAHPVSRRRWVWIVSAVALVAVIAVVVAIGVAAAGKPRRIAVSPLRALGPLEVLAGDVTGKLQTALVESEGLQVAEPGAQARLRLSGSMRGRGNGAIEVDLQVVDGQDASVVWAKTYHSAMAVLAESREDFARGVVEDVGLGVLGDRRETRPAAYLKARQLWGSETEEGLKQSVDLFKEAIAAAPGYAPAWSGLASAELRLSNRSKEVDTRARVEAARKASRRAIALNDGNAEAHAVLGQVHLDKDWDFRSAVRELRRAVVLDPVRLTPVLLYARALSVMGEWEAAERALEGARMRLPEVSELAFELGSLYFLARRYERMDAMGRELVKMAPNRPIGYWLVGLSQEQRGMLKEGVATLEEGLRRAAKDDLRTLCALGHAYGKLGDRRKAEATLERLGVGPVKQQATRFTLSYCAALASVGMGDRERAWEWLEKAWEGRDASLPFLAWDPRFACLQRDRRYRQLIARITEGS